MARPDPVVRECLSDHSVGGPAETCGSAEELQRLAGDQANLRVITIMAEQSGEVLPRAAELAELRGRDATLSSRESWPWSSPDC